MRCPICKQPVTDKGNPFRPFCSERCNLIDLENWLEGRYRVPDAAGEKPSPREPSEEDDDENGNGR